jgi:hypothetical protein
MPLTSKLICLGPVTFPKFESETIFNQPFYQHEGLPEKYARWQPTVDDMLRGIQTGLRIYFYAQQKKVVKGEKHYDRELHIDGNYCASMDTWGLRQPEQGVTNCTGILRDEVTVHASNMLSLRACVGQFAGVPSMVGSVAHIDTSEGYWVPMEAGFAYAGNETMFHESLSSAKDGMRNLVRLTIPFFNLDRISRY